MYGKIGRDKVKRKREKKRHREVGGEREEED